MINLYNTDCMELLKGLPDKSVDLAIVDPPYGINVSKMAYTQSDNRFVKQKNGTLIKAKKTKYVHKEWDTLPANNEYLLELLRVSKHQIIFGINYMDFHLKGGRIVWDKITSGETSFSDSEIAYCSMQNKVTNVYYMWAGMFQGVYCGTDIRKAIKQQGNKKLNEERIHPTQKPVALYKWLLNNYAKEGDLILDTHGGSMSSAIACYDMGFDMIGCELDKDYFDAGVKRFETHKLQQKMF